MATPGEVALAKAEALLKRLRARRPEIEQHEAYFRGEHPLVFASKEWAREHAGRFRGFSDNWCGVVGSAAPSRTEVFGFRVGEDGDVQTTDEQVLWRDWEVNEGPAQASQGFLAAALAKRSFVIVWGDRDGAPVMTWEHPGQVLIDYDPANPRAPRAMIKAWHDDDIEHLTLYEADVVWKWSRAAVFGVGVGGLTPAGLHVVGDVVAGGGGWVPRQGEGDDTWPIRNPLGRVPGVEFQNRPVLGGEPLSDIAGTMAMQNAANLLWAYLFGSADWVGMPARVVMGQEPPKIPVLSADGQKVGETQVDIDDLKRGRMLWLTGQDTKIGQWQAAQLDVFTDVINIVVRHISAQTQTPIYLIHGELGNVNGDTLAALDGPLNGKVREGHKFYTSPARGVFSLMAAVRGNQSLARECLTGTVLWRNPELRSDAQIADAATKDRAVGLALATVLEERYGWPQTKIARALEQVRAERADPVMQGIADTLAGLDRNGGEGAVTG